jgi:O-antigen/teichoic acid export membrane protein
MSSTDSNDVIKSDKNKMAESVNKLGVQGTLLFLDQLLVAAGGWIYWLVISKITSTSEIGQATAVYSLVVLTSTLTQLGLEYPLLKKSYNQKYQILGTTLLIELIITLPSLPIVFYVVNNNLIHQDKYLLLKGLSDGGGFVWIAIGTLILSSIGFVSRFALLGVSDARSILIIDVIGTGIKFAAGYTLVSMGFGAFGMLIAFLLQSLLISSVTLAVARTQRKFGLFKVGNIKYIKEIIRDGLINTPSKLSRVLILSLSIVLLASFGISNSEIGTFYVALMISIVAAGGLASNMAFMVIPASTTSKTDLSAGSVRIGLSFTAPLIAPLIVAPRSILSMIGTQYISAEMVLLILSISIFPSSITMNAISKFNNLDKSRKLISIGSSEIVAFLIAFLLLVPYYGTLGAAFSTLVAFICSSVLSIVWLEWISMRYIAVSCISIIVGAMAGYIILSFNNIGVIMHPFIVILASSTVALIVVIALKNTSFNEIGYLVKTIVNRR